MSGDNLLETMWNTVRSWVDKNADHYVYARIPWERTDTQGSDEGLEPGNSYFRLWLSEMFLNKSVAWGKEWFPAVLSEVKLQFGGTNGITFSHVVRPPEQQLGQGVRLNYQLTELIPFNGGTVEQQAALLALPGANYLGVAIQVLQQFSSLVSAPLSQTLSIAQKVAVGAQDLFSATQGRVHLGLHDTYVAPGSANPNVLRAGYVAVILATAQQIDPKGLSVKGGRLYYRTAVDAEPEPLTGYDYMLFLIEGRKERDDWRLKNIDEPMQQAISALLAGETDKAKALKTTALTMAYQSPDLAVRDRRRVVMAIEAELAEIGASGQGAVGDEMRDLGAVFKARAISAEEAIALGPLTWSEVMGE